eukprot:2983251-Amphidinium_carterae.1
MELLIYFAAWLVETCSDCVLLWRSMKESKAASDMKFPSDVKSANNAWSMSAYHCLSAMSA